MIDFGSDSNSGIDFGSDSRSEHHHAEHIHSFKFVVRLKNKRKDAREKRVLYMYSEKFVELGRLMYR
jgi:hypothetical protein